MMTHDELQKRLIDRPSHTPGPWTVKKETVWNGGPLKYPLYTIWTDRSSLLARTYFAPASEANAQLMAAAPDLLAALKLALATIETWHSIHDADEIAWEIYSRNAPEMKPIHAAIAKAEGGQP